MRIVAFASIVLLAGCKSDITTSPFGVQAVSRITGVVVDSAGRPVANARLSVQFPPRELYGYAASEVRTNTGGEFVYLVNRMTQPAQTMSPDTVTATVTAEVAIPRSGVASRAGSTSALLRFAPPDAITPVVAVTIILTN